MPLYPTLKESYTYQQVTEIFQGYNHNLKIEDGEFYDMENLTSYYYPFLANRGKRGIVSTLEKPNGLLAKSKLAYVDGSRLIYDGEDITSYLTEAGCTIADSEKQLVSMGAYIVIFPDKLYINTENYTDCGSIDAEFSTAEAVSYSLCKADGTAYAEPTLRASAPESPNNGDLWIDTSGATHVLKQYSSQTALWTDILTVYTKISSPGIGKNFLQYDGVNLSGCAVDDEEVKAQIEALNGSKLIYDRGDDYIVVVGLLDKTCTQQGGISVARAMPDMDFIVEAQNRLWGCKYGIVNGVTLNEIYCCALGDFKNWKQYMGISTDSWTASVGTDGPWTGAVTLLGYPIFFKENVMHKVYISSTGAHRIVDMACRGVQKGSHKSLVVVNETLFYKGVTDICAYDGSLPETVSPQLGTERYSDATAGCIGDKYYVSMKDKNGEYCIFVLDTAKNFWHKEDKVHALFWARCNGDLFFIDEKSRQLLCVNGSMGEAEGDVKWIAISGLMGYETVEQKYISRFNLRMKLPVGSRADVFIQYDSDGNWHHAGHMEGIGTKTFMLPVRPRRCDHFQLMIKGCNEARIYSFAKVHETGSDG